MEPKEIFKLCETMDGVVRNKNWGEEGIFYNPGNVLNKGAYIMTIKLKDGDNDKCSNLNRGGLYRVNTGISKPTFRDTFGEIPARPAAGGIVNMPYDFSEINKIMPHPVYAWMGWICVINPTQETFEKFYKYIEEAYELAKKRFAKRVKK